MLLAYCYSAGVMAADCMYRCAAEHRTTHHLVAVWDQFKTPFAAGLTHFAGASAFRACNTSLTRGCVCAAPAPPPNNTALCLRSVLTEFTRRFTEADVAMMLTLLNAIGLQLRSADPAAMKV